MPPSQKMVDPILTIGSAGGNAPLAITCSRSDDFLLVVEVQEISSDNIDGIDGEMRFAWR